MDGRLVWQAALFDPSGYSEEARCLLYACHAEAFRVPARNWATWDVEVELAPARRALLEEAVRRSDPVTPFVDVIHKTIPPASRVVFREENGPTVLRTMFETDSLPAGWASEVSRYHRIWVPSEFNCATFERAGVPREKLRVLPQTLDFPAAVVEEPRELRDASAATRFLAVFDFSERKGWKLLLDAWATAFSPRDDVLLVLKCGDLVMDGADPRRRIAAHLGERSAAPVRVIDRPLGSSEMAGLYRACDAFVLPSRGEGWGRPFMEAMAAGLPTIGPAWGGNRAFMSESNSFLLPGELVRIGAGDLVFERYVGQRWFDPDRASLVEALRTVAAGGDEVRRRAARGARDVNAMLSWRSVVRRLKELTEEALASAG